MLKRVLRLRTRGRSSRSHRRGASTSELMSGSFATRAAAPHRVPRSARAPTRTRPQTMQFGSSVEYEDLHSIGGVFTEVQRGHVDYGLVPIENSLGGGIVETLDAFRGHRRRGRPRTPRCRSTCTTALLEQRVRPSACAPHPLQARGLRPVPPYGWRRSIRRPNSCPRPVEQRGRCARPPIEEDTASPSRSSALEPGSAAIGSELAGEIYGLKVLFANIEDDPEQHHALLR